MNRRDGPTNVMADLFFSILSYCYEVFCFWGVWKVLDFLWTYIQRKRSMDSHIIPFPQIFKISDYRKPEKTEENTEDIIPFKRSEEDERLRANDTLSSE